MSKSSLAVLFGSDKAKETDGIVIEYGAIRVRIARQGGDNKKFAKMLEAKMRPYRRMIANDLLPEDTAKAIMFDCFAETIVLDWSGVTDDDGNELPFTTENCVAMFEKYPEFWRFVQDESTRLSNFRTAAKDADTKN